jgi:hypothetical protein
VAKVLALLGADEMIAIVGGIDATPGPQHGTDGTGVSCIRHRDQEGAQMRRELFDRPGGILTHSGVIPARS